MTRRGLFGIFAAAAAAPALAKIAPPVEASPSPLKALAKYCDGLASTSYQQAQTVALEEFQRRYIESAARNIANGWDAEILQQSQLTEREWLRRNPGKTRLDLLFGTQRATQLWP